MTATTATATRPSGPNGWLVIGGVFTVLLLAAGALSVAGWLSRRIEVQNEVYRQAVSDIVVELSTGDLTLSPGEADVVSIERRLYWSWSYQTPLYEERWDGETLSIDADCGDWIQFGPGCGVDYTMQVPEGISVVAHTSTGNLRVTNILGSLQLSTSTGDVTVDGASGDLRLDTSTGNVRVSGSRSSIVDASTSTGDVRIQLVSAPRTVTADTSTGDVEVVVPDGASYHVRADTSTGDTQILVRQDVSSSRSISANTSTGDVEVYYG